VTAPPTYVLDANVLIQAAREFYAFDLVPAFWDKLLDLASNGRVLSIDRVKFELDRGNDELKDWANRAFHHCIASTQQADVLESYREIMEWAQAQTQYRDGAKAEFADEKNADAWLVAYAKAKGCTIVTREQPAPESRTKIKIPDVCRAFEIEFVDLFAMLRALEVKLG
jgi:hypothetical protein